MYNKTFILVSKPEAVIKRWGSHSSTEAVPQHFYYT